MDRRRFLALTVPVALVLAACGGDDADPSGSPIDTTPTSGAVDTGAPVGDGIEHPTAADQVVLRFGSEGGFVPRGYAFVNLPNLLVTGDGHVIEPGVMTAIFPGPLVKPLFTRTITEDGIQALLSLADENQLLEGPPTYARNDMVADAPDTVVLLQAAGGVFEHRAYALGFEDESDPARARLASFTQALGDLTAVVGAENLGDQEPYAPTAYRLQALEVNVADWAGQEPAPVVVKWPSDAPVALADAGECAQVDAAFGDSVFTDATELTFFEEGKRTFQLAVAPLLPGDATC